MKKRGGGAWINSNGDVVNCTFAGNTSSAEHGAGLFYSIETLFPSPFSIANSVFCDNTGNGVQSETAQLHTAGSIPSVYAVTHSGIENSVFWINRDPTNRTDAPVFVDLPAGDARLEYVSPYKDQGDQTYIPPDCTAGENPAADCDVDEDGCTTEPAPDEDERRRIRYSEADIGAYEILCAGDLDEDGDVDVFDLFVLVGEWGACSTTTCVECDSDLGGPGTGGPDGTVDVFDLFILLGNWGGCDGTPGDMPQTIQECMEKFYLESIPKPL